MKKLNDFMDEYHYRPSISEETLEDKMEKVYNILNNDEELLQEVVYKLRQKKLKKFIK